MKVTGMLIRNAGERTRKSGYMLLYVLLATMIVFGIADKTVYAQFPFLLLDVSNNNVESQTEPGFTSFTSVDSGSVIDGITVVMEPLTATSLDARLRGAPTGITYELVYRDFVFARPGGIRITLSGLDPSETYGITIYAYDTSSAGDRIADWINANTGEFVLTTSFTGGENPTDENSHAFYGLTQSDDTGTIVLECGPNENTAEQSGANNPYAFVNALVVSSMVPLNKARRPVPEDGAIITTTETDLQWQPGMTSVSSNVYFGEDFDDVNNATTANTDIFRGNTTDVSFPVGSAGNPYPDGLADEMTYYWRIDEVEEDGTQNKGDLWRFTIAAKTAFNPSPADGMLFVDPNVSLSWIPGAGSVEHHVFFGENLQDVQAGTGGTDKGTVTVPNYTPGTLELEKTYYWRVDESDGTNTHTGSVWSFTTTLEGLGTVVIDMWEDIDGSTLDLLYDSPDYPGNPTWSDVLTELGTQLIEATENSYEGSYGARIHGWLYAPLSGEYTFYFTSADQGELWLSTDEDPDNAQLLTSEAVWGSYNTFSHRADPVQLEGGNKYYIMAIWKEGPDWDHCQAAWQGPGIPELEIIQGNYLSPFKPVTAYSSNPRNGSEDLRINSVVLGWSPSAFVDTHNVYFGTSADDINDVNADNLASYPNVTYSNVGISNYEPELLNFNTTYYWRVDEVNDALPESPWKGNVWSFSTGNNFVLDDFESYNDINPDEEGSKRIYMIWSDGYANPSVNGSTIGYPDPVLPDESFVETDIVNSGNQSAPLLYDNTVASYSEATLSTDQISIGQDWTTRDFRVLTLRFYGDPNNIVTEQLYVKLNDTKIIYDGDPANLAAAEWVLWGVNLSAFGIDLTNVTQISIGLERTGAAGSSGTMFIDDIRLHETWPSEIPMADPGTGDLVAYYALDGDASDSSGNGLDGTIIGDPNFVEGAVGMALDLYGDGNYVDCGNADAEFDITGQITVATWINIRSVYTDWMAAIVKGENAWRLATQGSNTNFQFGINYWQSTANYGVNGSTQAGIDEWHHICGTYDGATITIYFDGVIDGTISNDVGIGISTTNLWIGANSEYQEQRYWDGLIDEVYIYNRALSEPEIRFLANQ